MGGPDPQGLDELDELPPLDGDARDPAEPEPDYTDLLDETDEAGGLDDATAEDEPADADEIDLDESEGGWLDEASDSPDLDLGEMPLVEFGDEDSMLDDSESAAGTEEDVILGDMPERGGLDAGEEGPTDADEELREADLPALDADEEGDVDDASLVDPGFVAEEPRGLPWAALPWTRVGAPLPFAVATAVACADRGALVLGRLEGATAGLVRVDLEGACEVLAAEGLKPAGVTALAVEGSTVAAVQAGKVFVSRDGGVRFGPAPAPTAEGISAGQVALLAGRLWVGTRSGGLLVEDLEAAAGASGPPVERCALPGAAAAMTRDPAGGALASHRLAVLVVDDRGRPTALVRGAAGGSMEREVIDAPEARASALLAVRGEHAAYAAVDGGIVRRAADGGWRSFSWEGTVTALAFLDDAGTMVAANYVEADDTTAIVRLEPGGDAAVVARVGGASPDGESDGRVAALAYDEARGVVWVAGGFGVAVFAVR